MPSLHHLLPQLLDLLQVLLIDLTLAGDNAVVVGLAVIGLPARERRLAILFGVIAATLIRIGLVNYAAAALLMPYQPFLEAATALRYDVELLAARFSVSFEQAAHRLSTLQRPEQRGVPIFFLRLDAASNITKSFSNAGFPIAQHGGSCARWIGNTALSTPGLVRVQLGQLPDGATYLCVARTVTSSTMGWNDVPPVHVIVIGCERERAGELIYSDGIDLPNAVQRIGTSCRLCDWPDCRSRAFPPLAHRLTLDPHQRGLTRYPFERDSA